MLCGTRRYNKKEGNCLDNSLEDRDWSLQTTLVKATRIIDAIWTHGPNKHAYLVAAK